MKVIAHTTGNFQLLDGQSGDLISAFRPSVVTQTPFINARRGLRQIEIIAEDLPDDASDVEFAKHWQEANGDMELAVQSYVATFEAIEGDAQADSTQAPRRARKKVTPTE